METGLTLDEADEQLCRRYEAGERQAVIAEALGMTKANVEVRLRYYRDKDQTVLKKQRALGFFNDETRSFHWEMWPTLPKKPWATPPGCVSGQAPEKVGRLNTPQQQRRRERIVEQTQDAAHYDAGYDMARRTIRGEPGYGDRSFRELLDDKELSAMIDAKIAEQVAQTLAEYERGRRLPPPPYFTGKKRAFQGRIDSGILDRLKEIADERHQSLTQLYTDIFVDFIDEYQSP